MTRLLPAAVTALVILFLAEGQRAYFASVFALVYEAVFPVLRPGPAATALLPLAVLAMPLLPLARWLDRRAAIAWAAVAVALVRIPMTYPGLATRLVGGGLVVGSAAAFLTWAVGRMDRRAVAMGVVVGLVADQLLRLAGSTYDVTLRPGWLPFQVALSLGLVALVGLWYRDPQPEQGGGLERRAGGLRLRGALALGALLFAELHVLGQPAVMARWTGVPYELAAGGIGAAGAAAVFATSVLPRPSANRLVTLLLVLLTTAGPLLALALRGALPAAVMTAGHLAALLLVTRALDPASGRRTGALVVAGFALFVLLTTLWSLTFYASFTIPAMAGAAPWILVLSGAVLASAFVLLPRPADLPPAASPLPGAVAGTAVLVVAVFLVGWGPDAPRGRASSPDRLRVVTWNVHYGFDESWRFDPGAMATVLDREAPDLVALQEVTVGAPTAYGIDLPLWLGRRLGMRPEFSAAVNGLLGDAFLARVPADVRAAPLPAGRGDPKQLLSLATRLGDVPVTLHALHLGVVPEDRDAQIRAALPMVGTGPAVVLGDLNAQAGSAVIRQLERAGFRDVLEGRGPATFPASSPTVGIDWIWIRGLEAADARVLSDTPSDHRAVVATLRPPEPDERAFRR